MNIFGLGLRMLKFIVVGLVFAGIGEYWFSVLIRGDVANFVGSIVFNTIYLTAAYGVSLLGIRASGRVTVTSFGIASGIAGLMIEWFLIGNSPWGNPQASQTTMFAYWAGMVMMPLIYTDDRVASTGLRQTIVYVCGGYAAVVTGAGHLTPPGPGRFALLIWAFIAGYVAAAGFYVWYLRLLKTSDPAAEDPSGRM